MTAVEFECIDCHRHIVALGMDKTPEDRRCAVCRWLAEFVGDEDERAAMRARLQGE